MKKLVIFDLDGTLLNTIEDITTSLNVALKCVSLPPVSVEDAKYFVGSGVDILIERLLKFELKEKYEELKNIYYDKVRQAYLDDYKINNAILTKPYDGITELISKLKKNNIKVAVLSNKPHLDTIKVINDYFGSVDFFDYVIGKKDYNRIKPYPDGANEIIRYLEDKFSDRYKLADIVYVGDTLVDIETAKNIGCESIACLWGFRKKDELKEANYIVSNTLELYDCITKKYNGVIVLNKEEGISSNKIINEIKYYLSKNNFPISKIGHAGTLDPLATGVMVVLINSATKLSDYLMCEEKEYECELTFGESYDTLDITGKLLNKELLTLENYEFIKNNIDACLTSFIGESMQTPPMYSSIKVNGVKLYDLARNGEVIDRKMRLINIKEIERISEVKYINNLVKVSYRATVSKGTYIRSLCESIGAYFNIPCAMSKLKRIRSGKFNIDKALSFEDIKNKNNDGSLNIISMKDALSNTNLKIIEINGFKYERVKHGMPIRFDNIYKDDKELGLTYNGDLVAIYENTSVFDEKTNKYSFKVKVLC